MAEFRSALFRNIRKYGLSGIGVLFALLVFRFLFWLLDEALGNVFLTYINTHGPDWLKWLAENPLGSLIGSGILFVSFCAFMATRDEWIRKYIEFVREPDIPKLAVLWHPGETVYVHRYTLGNDPVMNTEFRICIKNTSQRTTLEGIRVRLENLVPHNLPCAPCCMRLMNNTEEPWRERFDLDPDEEQFISLFVQKPNADQLWFLHITPRIPWNVPAVPYSFDIVARRGATRSRQRFELFANGSHWEMRAINA